ncbi:MAG: GNAT family N-acetyltransferase [Chitinophagales bacterium]|nr:GNAT family N-acetyltransferase [Chitinophagaceae bacterium]MCB9063891.1 GNAT family N-acetyltransferase [Chitinophagales bacterium]
MNITLRKTELADLDTLVIFQTDEEANHIAAFNSENPKDKGAYMAKWSKIVERPDINMQTIVIDNAIAGSVIHFDLGDETNVSYWIDRPQWGKGIATKALQMFLGTTDKKTLHARVAFDNIGSQKVLEKNNFIRTGSEEGFANGRGREIEEFIYMLER